MCLNNIHPGLKPFLTVFDNDKIGLEIKFLENRKSTYPLQNVKKTGQKERSMLDIENEISIVGY